MPRYRPAVGDPLFVSVPAAEGDQAVTIAAWNCTVDLCNPGDETEIATSSASILIQNLFLDPSIFRLKVEALGADSSAFVTFHRPLGGAP